MIIELPVFLMLVLSVIGLSGSLIGLIIAYEKVAAKTKTLDLYPVEKQAEDHASLLLDNARDKAFQIVQNANTTAREMLESSRIISVNSKKLLEEQIMQVLSGEHNDMEKTAASIVKIYEEKLEDLKNNNINLIKDISKGIEKDTISQLTDFQKILEEETISSQKIVERKIEAAYRKAEADVDAYRETQKKKIDEEIGHVIVQITKDIIGKSLTIQQHHEIVIKALDEMKMKGVFNERT